MKIIKRDTEFVIEPETNTECSELEKITNEKRSVEIRLSDYCQGNRRNRVDSFYFFVDG